MIARNNDAAFFRDEPLPIWRTALIDEAHEWVSATPMNLEWYVRSVVDPRPSGHLMQRKSDRVLTSHTGSLSRCPHLVRMLLAREAGDEVDPGALAEATRSAVADVVRQQVSAGQRER